MNLSVFIQDTFGRFKHQRHRVAGVSWAGGTLHIALTVHRRGHSQVEKLLSLRLPEGSVAEKGRALKAELAKAGLGSADWVLTFPQLLAIVKTLTLPAIETREIQEMVRFQAVRQTPLGIEDLAVAWQIVDQTAAGYSRAMLAIVRKEDIQERLEIFREAGLVPGRLVLDTWVSLPLIRAERAESGLSLVIEVREMSAAFGIFEDGVLCGTRTVPLPPDISAGFKSWSRTLREELEKTLLAYPVLRQPDEKRPIDLCGKDELLLAAQDAFLSLEGVVVKTLRPWQRFAYSQDGLKTDAWDCWPALAASLHSPFSENPSLNLIPQDEQQAGTKLRRRHERLGVLACAVLFCSIFIGTLWQQLHAKQVELTQLARASAGLSPQVKELRRMERRINSMKAKMNQEGSFLSVVSELNRNVPPGVSLNSVDFEGGRSVLLQGTCFALPDALRLVETLQKSALFSAVELRSSEVERLRERDLIGFSISCKMKSHASALPHIPTRDDHV